MIWRLLLLVTLSCNSIATIETLAREVESTVLISEILAILDSTSSVMEDSTNLADAPGNSVITEILRCVIRGSSILGSEFQEETPAATMTISVMTRRCKFR